MEKNSQMETLKPSQSPIFPFPPIRRRPLQSQTYRTFVQIISHCNALQSLPQRKQQGEALEEEELVGVNRLGEAAEPNELLDHDPVDETGEAAEQDKMVQINRLGEAAAPNEFLDHDHMDETGEAMEEDKMVQVNRLGEAAETTELLDHDPMETGSMLIQQNLAASKPMEGDLFDTVHIITDNNNGNHVDSFLEANQTIDSVVNMTTCQNDGSDVGNAIEVSLNNNLTHVDSFMEANQTIDNVVNMATGQNDGSDVGNAIEVSLNNNGNHVDSFMEANQTIGSVVNMTTGQKDGSNFGDAIEVSLIRQEEVDKQAFLGEAAEETVVSSLEMDMVAEFSKAFEDDKKNCTEEKTLPEGIEHQLQLTEKEFEKLISTSVAMDSSVCLTADDIEEGEISGDTGVYDFLLDDAVSLEEKKGEEAQIHLEINDKEEFTSDGGESGHGKYGRHISASLDIVDNHKDTMKLESTRKDSDAYARHWAERDIEITKVDGNNSFLETGQIMDRVAGVQGRINRASYVDDLASHGQVIPEGRTENKDSGNDKKDKTVEKKKRKRGPGSKENKQKKKRIKRAEKNRELGVNRLKLQPIVKPKKVTYCRHYLKGRCQEGEKCKFSHDIIPLTKSQPCCHFARHSCMKGDACPFDHDLSKYPCNNYVDKGFCSRGADCLFSHKLADREDSLMTSNVPKPEFKSPFETSNSNSKNQVKIHGNPPQNSSCKSSEKKAQPLQKPATQAPKGICVFSPLGLSPGNTSKHEQAAQPLKGNSGVKTGHKMITSSLGSGQKSNDLAKRMSMRAPKGINFLSFGKAAPLDSGGDKDRGVSESLLLEPNESTPLRSPSKNDGGAKTENQSWQSSLESNTDKPPNMISPASRPQGIKFLAFGEIPKDNSSSVGQAGLLHHNSFLPLAQERENVQDGLKLSNETPCRLAYSSNPFRQSSHQSSSRNAVEMSSSQKISLLSNTPSSVQKALQSTLAFAAKFDSQVKLGPSIGTLGMSSKINQQSSSSL